MKFLLDTNVIIPAEPTSKDDIETETPNVIELLGLSAQLEFQCYIHPVCLYDIKNDRDEPRRRMRLQLLNKYLQLPAAPALQDEVTSVIGIPQPDSHDFVDAHMLAAIVRNSVDFLITNDIGIHKQANKLGIEKRVLIIAEALAMVRGFLPQPVQPPPAVQFVYSHELHKDDAIFDSLRNDYPGFDDWFGKIQRKHRRAFVIRDNEKYAGVSIIKHEETNDVGIQGPALKICTFKVADTARGYRYGELLLKAIFDYAHSENVIKTYLTCHSNKQELIRFLKQFGFVRWNDIENDELVFIKRFVPEKHEIVEIDPLDYHIKFGPYKVRGFDSNIFFVPIQPKWHKLLFPDLESQLDLFSGKNACGNSILKAYLCNSLLRTIPLGSILLFYRSQDLCSIQAVGVVDDCLRSNSATEIAQFVGKRTVYSIEAITEMCKKETLAILFRYAMGISPIQLKEIIQRKALLGAPQQITRIKPDGEEWIKKLVEL